MCSPSSSPPRSSSIGHHLLLHRVRRRLAHKGPKLPCGFSVRAQYGLTLLLCGTFVTLPLEIGHLDYLHHLHTDTPSWQLLLPISTTSIPLLSPQQPIVYQHATNSETFDRYRLDYLPVTNGAHETGRQIRAYDAVVYQAERTSELDRYVNQSIYRDETLDYYEELTFPSSDNCYRPKWTYELHPTCNTLHDLSMFATEHSIS